jgi:hypothetical protein
MTQGAYNKELRKNNANKYRVHNYGDAVYNSKLGLGTIPDKVTMSGESESVIENKVAEALNNPDKFSPCAFTRLSAKAFLKVYSLDKSNMIFNIENAKDMERIFLQYYWLLEDDFLFLVDVDYKAVVYKKDFPVKSLYNDRNLDLMKTLIAIEKKEEKEFEKTIISEIADEIKVLEIKEQEKEYKKHFDIKLKSREELEELAEDEFLESPKYRTAQKELDRRERIEAERRNAREQREAKEELKQMEKQCEIFGKE